jgi:hypothetical protein
MNVMHNQIGHALFAALRQNRTQKISFGRSSFFAPKAQKKMNVRRCFLDTILTQSGKE